jgi:hypothetical protein
MYGRISANYDQPLSILGLPAVMLHAERIYGCASTVVEQLRRHLHCTLCTRRKDVPHKLPLCAVTVS